MSTTTPFPLEGTILVAVVADVINAAEVRDFTVKQNFAEKFAKQLGAEMGQGVGAFLTGFTLR